MDVLKVREISEKINITEATLRIYLGHFSFNKFRIGNKYQVCDEFYKTLLKYLKIKKSYKYIKNLERALKTKVGE